MLQPIAEESMVEEDSSSHHKESLKDSAKNASKILGSVDAPVFKSSREP